MTFRKMVSVTLSLFDRRSEYQLAAQESHAPDECVRGYMFTEIPATVSIAVFRYL